MATTNYNIRLDEALKNQAFSVIEGYGLTPAQAIKLFLHQVAETGCIPLDFSYQKGSMKLPISDTYFDGNYREDE